MQIKRFEAKNMTTALRLIKDELGPDAVILSARSLKKGKGIFGSLRTSGVEVTAAVDGPYAMIARQADLRGDDSASGHSVEVSGVGSIGTVRQKSIQPAGRADRDKVSQATRPKETATPALTRLERALMWHDLNRDMAAELMDEIKRIPRIDAVTHFEPLVSYFAKVLEDTGICAGGLRPAQVRPQIVALVGGSGVGKTTTLAKLAAQQTYEHQRQVAVLSLDNVRIGAMHQIQGFTRIIGAPLELAVNPSEIDSALHQFRDKDLILIDTPGLHSAGSSLLAESLRLLVARHRAEIYLLMNAATREEDLLDVLDRLKKVPVHRLIFTKLDETTRYGSIVNVLIRTQIPLGYLATGPVVPGDLEHGTSEELAKVLCRQELAEIAADGSESGEPASSGDDAGSPPGIEAPGAVVANKNSDVYHVPTCKWARRIKPGHLIRFESQHEAESQKFMPCRNCCVSQEETRKGNGFPRDRVRISGYH
jgi:flagellar biosynthesis protein FlhF